MFQTQMSGEMALLWWSKISLPGHFGGVRKCKSVVSSDINVTGNERPRCPHRWWRIYLYPILIFSLFPCSLWHSNDCTGSYNFLITRLDKSPFTIRLNTDYSWAKEATLGLSPHILKWTFYPENEVGGDLFSLLVSQKYFRIPLCIYSLSENV